MKAKLPIQIASLGLACISVFAVPLLCDLILETPFTMIGIFWLNVGVACMRVKKIDFPLPCKDKLDPLGGIKTIWWAALWPNYLIKSS